MTVGPEDVVDDLVAAAPAQVHVEVRKVPSLPVQEPLERETVTQGIDAGEFRSDIDPPIAAALIMGVMRGIVLQVILQIDAPVNEQLQAAMKRGLLAGLTVGAEKESSEKVS